MYVWKLLTFWSFSPPRLYKRVCIYICLEKTFEPSPQPNLLTLVACRPGTIFFGSFTPRALKNPHSNYSTSVLAHFSPPCLSLSLENPAVKAFWHLPVCSQNFVQMPSLQCSSIWRAGLEVFFVCHCVRVCECTWLGSELLCVCLLGLGSWKHTHG